MNVFFMVSFNHFVGVRGMKLLNATESARILEVSNKDSPPSLELRVDFSSFLDRSAPLSRLIVSMIGKNQPNFLWIREFGIWPSLENWALFESLRAASGGIGQSLSEMPGHKFESADLSLTISYVQVMILNGWGGVLIALESQQRIAISHDSWLSIKPSVSIRDHIDVWHSFRSMRRMDARCRNASARRFRHSQSLASLRHRFSQAIVRSTTGCTILPNG